MKIRRPLSVRNGKLLAGKRHPSFRPTHPQRAVACFLYEGAPVLRTEEMDRVLQANGVAA